MRILEFLLPLPVVCLFVAGCTEQRKISTTEGIAVIECDESVYPVLRLIAEDFQRSYKNATIDIRPVEAREAIADFLNDSVSVIVSAREFNKEEKEFTAASKLEFDDYYIALGAVAVVLNKSNPLKELRMSEVDSIFSGSRTRWRPRAGGEGNIVDVAVGGINSSVNEVVRRTVLTGKPFALTATSFSSSEKLVGYVLTKPGAVGITGVAWLKGHDRDLTVCALGTPGARPDSTQPPGKFYPPVQAHVYRKYYPITTPVHMYNRKVTPDVGYGFISYVTSPRGQQIILENGLVPVTMPVRLVELTQRQVQ